MKQEHILCKLSDPRFLLSFLQAYGGEVNYHLVFLLYVCVHLTFVSFVLNVVTVSPVFEAKHRQEPDINSFLHISYKYNILDFFMH